MRLKFMCLVALSMLGSGSLQVMAQKVSAEQAKEALRETLKEKWRPSKEATNAVKLLPKFKSTAADQRVTNNNPSVGEAEVSLAVHPADSNKVVLSFMEAGNGLEFPIYYSGDGGQSWSKSIFNSEAILQADFPGHMGLGGGDPVFAWDKNGRVYFSWIYLSAGPNFDTAFFTLNYAYSDNNGQTWTVPPGEAHFIGQGALDLFNQAMFDFKDGICDRQWMAVDNSNGPNQGKLYCSFLLQPGDPNALFGTAVKVKNPSNNSFGPSVNAYNSTTQFGNVEVDHNGVVHVSFADLNSDEIKHVSSSNGGTSFSSEHLIATGSNLFGGFNMVHDRENAATNMAVDAAGNLHVVYSSFPGFSVESYYIRSTNGGVNWSTPLNLNTLFNNSQTLMPVVAAAGNNVAISLSVIDNNDSARYFQLNSFDNGQSFGIPAMISSAPTYYPSYSSSDFFGDYNRSVRTTCQVYTGWSDGRGGIGPKVYFARTNFCATGIGEISSVNGTVQMNRMFPNPARDRINLQLTATENETAMIALTDMTGRTVKTKTMKLRAGKQDTEFVFGSVAAGAYSLSVKTTSGTLISRQLIIE